MSSLIGTTIKQLVFDLNAVYFVVPGASVKAEASIAIPPSPTPTNLDEAATLEITILNAVPEFRLEGEPEHWYRVFAADALIQDIEVVRTGIVMPGERVHALAEPAPAGTIVSPCDCGILVTTPKGILPAVQLENGFAFHHWAPDRSYTRQQVLDRLGDAYEVVSLQAGST